MKAEFEYNEEDVRKIILDHHNTVWGNFSPKGVWVAKTDYRGVIVKLSDPEKEETNEL